MLIHRPEVRNRPLDDFEAVAGQLQVADDLGIEQAHRVGGDGIAKAGVEFLGEGGPAYAGILFEHDDAKAGARQIRGRDEAVMPAANDNDIRCVAGQIQPPHVHLEVRQTLPLAPAILQVAGT